MVYASLTAGLTAALCWGTADYLSRSQSEKLGYYRTVVYSHLITLAFLVALIPVVSPDLQATAMPLIALAFAGALNFIAFNFLYRAFHRGVVSVVAPVAYTYPAVTAVLSVIILGTVLTTTSVLAIAGIITGVILLSTRFSNLVPLLRGRGGPNLTSGVTSAMGSSFFFGTVYIAIGYAAPLVSVVVPALVLRAVGVATGFLIAPVLKQQLTATRQVLSWTMVAMGGLEAAGFLSFTYGISGVGGSLPIVAALSGMGGAVAAGYGFALLKERLEPNQVAGVILSLAGVFTLLYFGG